MPVVEDSISVTIPLPKRVFERASDAAAHAHRPLEEQLATLIERGLTDGRLAEIQTMLDENERDVLEEGGKPLSARTRDFVTEAAREILSSDLTSIHIVPFARSDSGAYLIVDDPSTNKRLTVRVPGDQSPAQITQTSRNASTISTTIDSPYEVSGYLDWLTASE